MLPVDITFLGHATLLVQVDGLKIIFDPHLNNTYRSNLFGYYPERTIEKALMQNVDAIVISHSHRDHFDVSSLMHLDRTAAVFFPNDSRINFALKQLGFQNIYSVVDWTSFNITENLKITWTPSTFRVPEHGFLIEYCGLAIWNMVDSHVTKEWCNRVLDMSPNKCIDFVLLPCQPLIEANITHSLVPIVKKEDVEEIKMVLDIIKPIYTIPFADGHYCLNEASWINKHWIPFSELDKLEAIDTSDFKTQILDIKTGEKIIISKTNISTCFTIEKTNFIKSNDKQIDRYFDPSGFIPPIKAGDVSSANNSIQYLNELIENFKFDFDNRFPFLRGKIKPLNCNYTISLIDDKSDVKHLKQFSFFESKYNCFHTNTGNYVEIVISENDFINVYESTLSFSALLIGGRIREFHFLYDETTTVHVFRDFSDILSSNNTVESIISGIFIFNQLLTINSNRIFDEISIEINCYSYQSSSVPQNDIIFQKIIKADCSHPLFDKVLLNYVECHLEDNMCLDRLSKEIIINEETYFIGFFGDEQWPETNAKKGVLIPVNLLYSQTILGTGVNFPTTQFQKFVSNIVKSGISEWIFDISLLHSFDVPEWRIANLLPFSLTDLKLQLSKRGYSGDIIPAEFTMEKSNWWLGIPDLKTLTPSKNITIQLPNKSFVRGAINQLQISNMTFKSQQAFRSKIGTNYLKDYEILSSLVVGNIRFSWLFDEKKLNTILNQTKIESFDKLIQKIVLSILISELKN